MSVCVMCDLHTVYIPCLVFCVCFHVMCVHVIMFCCLCPSGSIVHPASSTFASSCAVASCGAQLTKTPLFLHLATFVPSSLCPPSINSAQQKTSSKTKFTMPIPVVSALAGGQLSIGKLRFREFCVTPLSGSPFPEQIQMLTQIHTELGRAVQVKAGVS